MREDVTTEGERWLGENGVDKGADIGSDVADGSNGGGGCGGAELDIGIAGFLSLLVKRDLFE